MMLVRYNRQMMIYHDRIESASFSTKKNLKITGFHWLLLIVPPSTTSTVFLENILPIFYANKRMADDFKEPSMASFG